MAIGVLELGIVLVGGLVIVGAILAVVALSKPKH